MKKIHNYRVHACALFLLVFLIACTNSAFGPPLSTETTPEVSQTVRVSSTVIELTVTRTPTAVASATVTRTPTAGPSATVTSTSTSPTQVATYTDPFAYCTAVGTIDQPDARYTGPKVPESVARAIMRAVNAPASAPLQQFVQASFWRCMGGKVYGCTVGANLPCEAKADVSRDPIPPMVEFCKQQPQSDFIPAVATGRTTVYEWQCRNGAPVIVRQVTEPDARGFIKGLWHELSPS